MAQKEINSDHFTKDISDFILYLTKNNVRYVIIGGQAVIFYGHSRLTGDIDFYYERTELNCGNLFRALEEFWEGDIPNIDDANELMKKNIIFQFGIPPNRIDLINELDNLDFTEIWQERETANLKLSTDLIEINFIGINSLIKNKEYAARPRDLEDLKFLRTVIGY